MYRLETYEQELRSTSMGRHIIVLIKNHINEVNTLMNRHREIMDIWKRNKGPIFISQFIRSGFDPTAKIKKEINGIHFTSFIRRMAVVLQDYGSDSLTRTIDEYIFSLLEYIETYDSLYEIFQKLKEYEQSQKTTA